MEAGPTTADSDENNPSLALRSSRIMLSLLLLVEILLIPSAILIFDLHPSLTLILVLEYSMTLSCFTSAAETKLKQLNFSIQMKLIAVVLTHLAAIMYACYNTPHYTIEILMESIQARVIHIKLSELLIYSIYFVIKVVTIATVSRSVVASLKNRATDECNINDTDEEQQAEQPLMYNEPIQQTQQTAAKWQPMVSYQYL